MKIRLSCLLLSVLLCGNIILTTDAQELSLEQVIERHHEYCRFFQKLHLEYREIRHSFSFDKTSQKWQKTDETMKWDWSYDWSCEILHCVSVNSMQSGDTQKKYLHLSYFKNDADNKVISTFLSPERIKEFVPSTVWDLQEGGAVFTLSNKSLDLDMESPLTTILGMKFIVPKLNNTSMTLATYIGLLDFVPILTSSEDNNGDILQTITFFSKKDILDIKDNSVDKLLSYKMVFNESKGFCLHQTLSSIPDKNSPAHIKDTEERVPMFAESTVLEYQKVADKFWIPKRIAVGFGTPWSREMGYESVFYKKHYEIDKIQINDEVKEENICLKLPEFSQVFRDDLFTGEVKTGEEFFIPISIWGKNNEPIITFYSLEEYNNYMKQESIQITRRTSDTSEKLRGQSEVVNDFRLRIILMTIGIVFIVLAILFRRLGTKKNK